jgi:hypothetical protein
MERKRKSVGPERLADMCRRLGARLEVENLDLLKLVDIATALGLVAGLLRQYLRDSGTTYNNETLNKAFRDLSAVEHVSSGSALVELSEIQGIIRLAQSRMTMALVELSRSTPQSAENRPVDTPSSTSD